jgi:predicted amidohydrolase YtcJ
VTAAPDLVVTGRIATLAGERGFGWVEGLAVADGRVVAAGTADEVGELAGAGTRRLRLEPGEVAIPGLTDSHLHLAETALNDERVDVSGDPTIEAGLERIAAAHVRLPETAWLEGHGWDSDRWGRWPTAADLATVAPGRLVAIWAHDHHSLWTSQAAMRLAGIDEGTADPPGGLVRRDADGGPTGILHEAAARLVTGHVPPATAGDLERAIPRLAARLLALGVVAVHDPGGLAMQDGLGPAFEAYRRLASAGAIALRIHACIREEQLDAAVAAGLRSGDAVGPEGGGIRFGWLKLFADGTLGSRTAALLEPIEPEPDRPVPPGTEHGVWMTDPAHLIDLARAAADAGIATTIHAIGDAAVRAALDALEPTSGRTAFMPRVEHVQLVHPDDVPRFGARGIAASVQPVHLRSDAAAARRLWGDRAERSGYAWATLERAGALLAFGTDAPVEPIDPWPGLAIAASRSDPAWGDSQQFGPGEALPLDRVLRAACLNPALSAGEARGRLVPGAPADLVVIPSTALGEPVPPGGPLSTARPRLVLAAGRTVFEA